MTALVDPPLERPADRPTGGGPRRDHVARLALGAIALLGASGVAAFLISSNVLVGILLVALAIAIAIFVFAKSRSVGYVQLMAVFIHFELLGSRTFTPGRILVVVTLLLFALRLLSKRERLPAIPPRFVAVVGLLITWIWMSGSWAMSAGRWMQALLTLTVGFSYFIAFAFFLDGPHQLRRTLRVYWVAGIVSGLATATVGGILGGRSVGFTGDPNIFVMYQSSLLPLTLYFASEESVRWRRLLHYVALATVAGATIAAASRSGLVSVSITLTVCFFLFGRGSIVRKLVSAAVGASLAAFVGVLGIFLNPSFVERGLADRGAGRLDVWLVARAFIPERPFQGLGAGNFASVSIQRLLVTPGVELVGSNSILKQKEITAHNIWMEVTSNLGLVGLALFLVLFGVTAVGFLRPRRRGLTKLHHTMAVMLLAVSVSVQFFGGDTNKLLWMLVGTAALLQTPLLADRFRPRPTGFAPAGTAGGALVLAGTPAAPDDTPPLSAPPSSPLDEARELSRVELRASRRVKLWMLTGGLVCMLATVALLSARPPRYTATHGVFVPDLEQVNGRGVSVNDVRVRTIQSLFLSEVYADRLAEAAGIDEPASRVAEAVSTLRPLNGAYISVTFTWPDRAETERVASLLLPVFDQLVADMRTGAVPATDVAIRPMTPNDVPDYRGPLYVWASQDPVLNEIEPQLVVDSLIMFVGGAMLVGVFVLMRAVRPTAAEQFVGHALSARVWGRLGRSGGKAPALDRALQTVASVVDDTGDAPRRMAIVGVSRRARRQVVLDLAGALAVTGQPVLIVDADPRRPAFGRTRVGWAEAVAGETSAASVTRRLSRRKWRGAAVRPDRDARGLVRVIGPGRPDEPVVSAGADLLATLPRGTMVLDVLPAPTGRTAVTDVLAAADATVVVVESGWTLLDDARDLVRTAGLVSPSVGVVTVAL